MVANATKEHHGSDGQARLVDALVQCAFATVAVLHRAGAEHDLSLTQLRVLGILRDRRLRMSTLADYLGLERSTLSGLVERAERRGLVVRTGSTADGRAVEVSLSRKGTALADRVHASVERSLAPLINGLRAEDRDRCQVLLERMLDGTRAPSPS